VVTRHDHALEQRGRRVLGTLELVIEGVANGIEDVETDEVAQRERSQFAATLERSALGLEDDGRHASPRRRFGMPEPMKPAPTTPLMNA
jgi:hypothetical protein